MPSRFEAGSFGFKRMVVSGLGGWCLQPRVRNLVWKLELGWEGTLFEDCGGCEDMVKKMIRRTACSGLASGGLEQSWSDVGAPCGWRWSLRVVALGGVVPAVCKGLLLVRLWLR